ncbi:uncharacterized protein [Clytia hemisphaerica]|uniref:VWFA domain-containing protein n=1 Tax=Clytia hemisphaerica TaxID=252671 RepID=A0A7M5V7C9_9CNID
MKWVIFGSSFHPLFWAWLLALLLTGPVLINGRSSKGLSRPHSSPTEKNVKRRSGIESNPVKPSRFQEVKIDTSKLYNELLKAIKKDKTPHVHQRQRGAVKSNTKPSTSKHNEKHSPSIGYFMNLKQKAGKPSSNRQLIEYALPNQQQATSDPYWGSMGRPMETSPIISESVPISPTQAMFQSFNRVVSQNTPTIYLNPPPSGGSSFETHSQQQTAKSITSNKPKTSKKETQIFHLPTPKPFVAVHHAPITKTFEESKASPSRETHLEKGGSKRVYSLGDNVFTDVGCYLDKWIRSIPTLEGNHPLLMDSDYKTRSDPLQKCAEAALDKGLKLFAIQNGGQCFGGKTGESRYNVYGTSDQCKEDGLGGSWANEVYSYRDDGVPKETKQTKQTVEKPKEEITQQSFLSSEEDEDQRLTRDNQIVEDFQGKQHNKEPSFKGALKNIMNKVTENKKQSQAEKNIKIVKEIVKNLKAAKGEKEEPPPASVLTSKQTLDGEEFGRLGDAIARGHKPPCICPDKICSSKLDLAFVIDAGAGSEQGGKEKMAETMEFGRRVASAFKVTPEETRVGLITYATDAQVMMNFHRYADPDAIVEARDAVRVKPHTGKYTGQALDLAKEGLFDSGHRADALDVAVLLTDGPSSDDVTLPARKLRDMGVKIITVGIGPEVDRGQLNDIASDPDEEHVFTADYDSLATIIGRTQRAACVGGMLHEPVDKCKCNMYVKNDDKAEEELDKETAAFYNVYKTAVEASPRDANAVKYNTIYRPWNKRGNQFYQAFPRHYYNGYISAMGHRRDNVAMLHKMLPLLNPHPVMDASPLAELHHKVNSTSVNVPSQRRTGNINKKLDLYEAKLKENAMEMYEKMQKSDKENGGDKQKGDKEYNGDKQKFDKEKNGDKEESKKYDGDNKHPQRMSDTEDRNDKQEKNGESEKKLKEVKDHSNEQEKGEENSRQGKEGKNEGRFTQDEQQRESSQHFTQSPSNDNEQQRVNSFSNDVSWKGKGKFSMGKWSNRLKGEKGEQEVADHEKLVSTGKNDEERNGEESKYTQQHQSKGEDHGYSHQEEGNREENRYPEESRFTQQHQHQADSKETDESPSKNGASDGELSSKEKERLVFNYLKAHRHEFMKEDSQPSDHHGEGGGGEQSRPANMYQHEQDNNQYGKGQQMYDERMGSNSEGKLHRADEEQVLADAKPLRQAGGSHELPFEYVAQEEDKHHPTSESHGMENESESSQQRHKFHGEDEKIGNEPMTREEMTEEKYKNVFNNEDGTKNDRSKGGEQSKDGKKEDGKKNGELFTSEDKNKEKEKDNEEDDDKYKSFQGFKFRYGPTESFNKQQDDKPKKLKKGKKIYPDDDSAPQQSIKTKPSVGGANFGVSDFTGTGGGVGGNTGGMESDAPSKVSSHHEHEEGTAPSPFEPEEKLSYHPTKEPGYSRFKDDQNREEERQPLSHQQNGMDKNTSPYHSHEIQEKHGENEHQSVTNRESFASAPNESEAFSIGKHHHVKGYADSHATFRIHNKKSKISPQRNQAQIIDMEVTRAYKNS